MHIRRYLNEGTDSNRESTTAFLADEFCIGAKEAGHEVVRFETAKFC